VDVFEFSSFIVIKQDLASSFQRSDRKMKPISSKKWAKAALVAGALSMFAFRFVSETNRTLAAVEPAGRSQRKGRLVLAAAEPAGRSQRKVVLADAEPADRSQSEGRRAFVCICGQLSRLEMDSKFENMFLPLQELGFQVDVAFALSTGRLVFSNPRKVKKQTDDMERVFANEASLLSYMKDHNLGVVSKKGFVYRRIEDPHLNIQYEHQLTHKSENATEQRIKERSAFRTANHARMYDSYQRCTRDIDRKTLQGYDLVVRIREDVGFPEPVQSRLYTDFPRNTIVSSDCRVWGGMNDRFAIAAPNVGAKLFTLPNQVFTGQSSFPTNIKNSEQFLKFVYSSASINMATSKDFRKVAKVYVDSNGKTRFWKEELKTGCNSIANIKA
jgi:hypothetical protein